MADLKLGSLVAEIFVEGGLRPHYGTRDSVTGKVFLEYVEWRDTIRDIRLVTRKCSRVPSFGNVIRQH